MLDDGARCPIGGERIDENAARVNGGLVIAILAVALAAPAPWLLVVLGLDFAVKVFVGFSASPICRVAGSAANALHLESRLIDSAPKRFAACIALLMCIAGLGVAYTLPVVAFYVVTGVFICFAILEAFAGFCMGCFLWPVARAPGSGIRSRVKGCC